MFDCGQTPRGVDCNTAYCVHAESAPADRGCVLTALVSVTFLFLSSDCYQWNHRSLVRLMFLPGAPDSYCGTFRVNSSSSFHSYSSFVESDKIRQMKV